MSLTEMEDTSVRAKDIYEELLKRYKEFGYLRPEDALNCDIRLLEAKGKTIGEAILRRYKGAKDETIELIEKYIAARARIPTPEEEKAKQSASKNRVRKKSEEIMAVQS